MELKLIEKSFNEYLKAERFYRGLNCNGDIEISLNITPDISTTRYEAKVLFNNYANDSQHVLIHYFNFDGSTTVENIERLKEKEIIDLGSKLFRLITENIIKESLIDCTFKGYCSLNNKEE